MFGVTFSPPKLGLANLCCFIYSVARKRFNRTFHSKYPCFRPYNQTSGPDKSAMRIPNLQATTTQSPKDFISGGITSCSVQLLLGIVTVQATHMYPLVHAPWHVHYALDIGLMQLHDLMLHSCLRLFNGEAGLRHQFTKHPRRVAASDLQVATVLLWAEPSSTAMNWFGHNMPTALTSCTFMAQWDCVFNTSF